MMDSFRLMIILYMLNICCIIVNVSADLIPKSLKGYTAKQNSRHVLASLVICSRSNLCLADENLQDIFDKTWQDEDIFFDPEAFRRLDEQDDSKYYEIERFVEHIDERAVNSLTKFHDTIRRLNLMPFH